MSMEDLDKAREAAQELRDIEAAAVRQAEEYVEAVDGDRNEQAAAEAAETAAQFVEAQKATTDVEAETEGNFI